MRIIQAMGAIPTMSRDRQDAAVVSAQQRFEALLQTHRVIVFKVASIYCRDSEEQRDLAQEIRTQAWRAYPRYDESRSFSTWMYRIALNVAISYKRSAEYRRRHVSPMDTQVLESIPDSRNETDDRVRVLYQVVDQLDDLNRALFRVVTSFALGLTWWVLWIAATMVGAKMWLGVDLYAESPAWINWSLGVGVLGMAASVVLARRFADRPTSSPTLQRMIDDLAARNLLRASRRLEEILQFERASSV